MASLPVEASNLHTLLNDRIRKIMRDASALPAFKDGILQTHLLKRAR